MKVSMSINYDSLIRHSDEINELLARYGVKFGIYKNNEFKEQLFPYDIIPRVIGAEEFAILEKGLSQRVMALNLFIKDISVRLIYETFVDTLRNRRVYPGPAPRPCLSRPP